MRGPRAPILRSAVRLRAHIKRSGATRVVLANGCFDPLHVGHVRYLAGAKGCGDFLVVAVNDDKSARALKGRGRPLVPAADRAQIVASLEMVDAVLIFSSQHVGRILKSLRPACHAKGTDYTVDSVPERKVAEALGIETRIVGDPKSHASSDIIERLRGPSQAGELNAS